MLQVLKPKANGPSKIRKVQSVSWDSFKMSKMKLKPMNGQVLGLKEGRKSKKSLVQPFLKGAPKKPKKRLDWDTLELPEPRRGFSESAGKNQLGFGQLRKACSWIQGTEKDMSHQSPTTQKKKALEIDDDLGTSIWWREAWYLRKSRNVNHERMWLKIFQLDKKESTYLKKKDKWWGSQKSL